MVTYSSSYILRYFFFNDLFFWRTIMLFRIHQIWYYHQIQIVMYWWGKGDLFINSASNELQILFNLLKTWRNSNQIQFFIEDNIHLLLPCMVYAVWWLCLVTVTAQMFEIKQTGPASKRLLCSHWPDLCLLCWMLRLQV